MKAERITSGTISPSASTPAELLDLFDRLTECIRDGDSGRVETLLREHPEHEVRLRTVLPALGVLNSLRAAPAPPGTDHAQRGSPDHARRGSPDPAEKADRRSPRTGPGPDSSHSALRIPNSAFDSTLGDFRLLRELGRGGMGVVYEAEQVSLGRRVAVKVLPLAGVLDKRALARFQNEARAAATLFHPHIVPVFFVGVERGVHFYAMQLIEGHSLAEVIAAFRESVVSSQSSVAKSPPATDHGPLTTDQSEIPNPKSQIETQPLAALSTERTQNPQRYFRRIAEIGIQIAQALHHAHEHGILHRDIKPANILLDDEGQAWITDFGLARLEANASMTATGDVVGTLRYMSPEQIAGSRTAIDHRTDVYSLGVTLYELAAGTPAFPGTDRRDLHRRIAEQEPRPPRQLRPEIPADLETILLKATEKDPKDRYSSAGEVADDLNRFTRHESIHARRPSVLTRVARWSRRHRPVVATALTTLFLALVVGTVLITRAYRSEQAERRAAEEAQRRAERSLALAREVVDNLYIDFAMTWIADETAPSNLQQEFLARASHFYRQILGSRPLTPADRRAQAVAYARIGWIERYLQDYSAAAASLQQSVAINDDLLKDDPSDDALHAELVGVNRQLGLSLVEMGRIDEADEAFASARRSAEILVKTFPGVREHALDVADLALARAGTLLRRGQLNQAEAQLTDATEAIQSLLREIPGDPPALLLAVKRGSVSTELLQAQGRLEPVREQCRKTLERCRRTARDAYHGSRPIELLEIQLVEKLAELESLNGNPDEAVKQYRQALARRKEALRAKLSPADLMVRSFFLGELDLDDNFEPGPFCGYLQTQLRLADVLRQIDRPYEAELHLGEAMLAAQVLTADKPKSLRYRVVEANTWALAARLFAELRPSDAEAARQYSASLWRRALQTFPQAHAFQSGVHGQTADYEWYTGQFPQIAVKTTPPGTGVATAVDTVFVIHARARSWFRNDEFADALGCFKRSAELRTTDHAYDWFHIAMCHAELGNTDAARQSFQNAVDAMGDSADVELLELRAEAEALISPSG